MDNNLEHKLNTLDPKMYGEKAEKLFTEGYNCAQAVVYAFNDILVLDDVQGFCDIEKCLDEEANGFIYDITTDAKYKKDYFMKLLIHDFYEYTEWCSVYEHDDLMKVEEYFASRYPDSYRFSMINRFKFFDSNPTPTNPETTEKRKICVYHLMQRITSLQTTVQTLIKNACTAYVSTILKNNITNKRMKRLHMSMIPVSREVDERLVCSMFANEKVIYITNHAYRSKNIFVLRNGTQYYPFLCKTAEMFTYFDIDKSDILKHIVKKIGKVNKRYIINSWDKLFNICKIECGFGVFDVNSDYRYTIFENVRRLIVDQQIETMLPAYITENELMWISDTDYMEQLPEWVGAFNSFSHVKIQ